MLRRLGIIACGVVALYAILPLCVGSVWDGHFTLQLRLEPGTTVDGIIMGVVVCRTESIADQLVKSVDRRDTDFFRPVTSISDSEIQIEIPCSGRRNGYGIETSYSEPRFLVLELQRSTPKDARIIRHKIQIPIGRGDRTMSFTPAI